MKKIMFNDRYGLTQAVLDGRKTMTRRIIKGNFEEVVYIGYNGAWYGRNLDLECVYLPPPQYEIGEELAIAQAYNSFRWPALPGVDWDAITDKVKHSKGWTNKMFVSADLMPYRVRITDVKAQMLREISNEDAMKEGIMFGEVNPALYGFRQPSGSISAFLTARSAYAALIDRICGKHTWERNPLVYVYSFELIK